MIAKDFAFCGFSAADKLLKFRDHGPGGGAGWTIRTERARGLARRGSRPRRGRPGMSAGVSPSAAAPGVGTCQETGTDRSYSCPVNGKRRPSATGLATSSGPRGGSWRQRVSGTLACVVVYVPWLAAKLFPLEWRWPGGFSLDYGGLLAALPGVVFIALPAPRVAYRRRDALLLLLLPPWGLRIGWVIGTRLVQLPHRDWPERTDTFPVHGRHAARIAAAAHSYRSWRQRRAMLANPALRPPKKPPSLEPCGGLPDTRG